MTSLEHRKLLAERLGNHVRGFAGGQLRIAGQLEIDDDELPPPVVAREPVPLPDYTSAARAEYARLRAGKKPPPQRDPLADAKADYARLRRDKHAG